MMKLLVLIAAIAAPVARANFQFSRKKLSDAAIASLRTEVEAGARFVTANDDLAKLFNVEAGHAVPAKVARGSVSEHQDRFSDSTAADLVQLLYLDGEKDHKFTLRDLRTGEEHSTAVEPGLLIEYDNQYYTHRVDASSSSARVLLGPTSAKAGRRVLERVTCTEITCSAGAEEYGCTSCLPEFPNGGQDPNSCCTTTAECKEKYGGDPECVVCPEDPTVAPSLAPTYSMAPSMAPSVTLSTRRSLTFGSHVMPDDPIQGFCHCAPPKAWCGDDCVDECD